MNRVAIAPELLHWACERSGKAMDVLALRFQKLPEWASGETQPTLKQLESFAHATYTPIGYFFLPEPPVESLPIPDFRTLGSVRTSRLSADLLDTVYLCQQRQEWYREFAHAMSEPLRAFVGSAEVTDDIPETATALRHTLGFDIDAQQSLPSWTEALRQFIALAEEAGVLVMVNGVVGNNTHRKLDPDEFRGFALSDEFAPLVFINGADTKAAQMFTLAHELAHIWLGQSALSDASANVDGGPAVERWCNQVAAELLAPLELVRAEYRNDSPLQDEMNRLARYFKVSTLVVLRRLRDAGGLSQTEFQSAYSEEHARLIAMVRGGGGTFYATQGARLSKRFARAIIVNTLEGRNSFTEAMRLLGVKKFATFRELGTSLEVYL